RSSRLPRPAAPPAVGAPRFQARLGAAPFPGPGPPAPPPVSRVLVPAAVTVWPQLNALPFVTDAPPEPGPTASNATTPAVVVTAKLTPLLGCPPTDTTTFPVVAPLGTGAVTLVALHAVGVASGPLNVTVLAPCAAPKFPPAIVTTVPTGPDVGDKLVMLGSGGGSVTVKLTPLLA